LHSEILETKWEYNEAVHELFIDFKKAYDSVRRKVLYSILIEFGVPFELVRLIEICLNETYIKVHIGKLLSEPCLPMARFNGLSSYPPTSCCSSMLCGFL
jgi:hypothetical protein